MSSPQKPDVELQSAPAPLSALIEVEPGIGVFFGEDVPDDLEVMPFALLDESTERELTGELATALTLGGLGLQVQELSAGVVRFDSATRALLETGHLMESGGKALGAIVNDNGRIIGQARFLVETGLQASGMLTALGAQAPLLALQIQLASISGRLDRNIELTDRVLDELRTEQIAELRSLKQVVDGAVSEARAAGGVSDHVYDPIRSRQTDVRKHRHIFHDRMDKHVRSLDASPPERRGYIRENAQRILEDINGMILAEQTWLASRVLRACTILHSDPELSENRSLFDEIVMVTRREHTVTMDRVADILDECERQCRLLVLLPPERSLPLPGKRGRYEETAALVGRLADHVARLRFGDHVGPLPVRPDIAVFEHETPGEVLGILRWILPAGETVIALADVNLPGGFRTSAGFMVVTVSGLFLASRDSVLRNGVVDQRIPLADIRYVRFRERETDGPMLDIITRDRNIVLTFGKWAAGGGKLDAARRLAELLMAAMNVPVEERRTDPRLELTPPDREPEEAGVLAPFSGATGVTDPVDPAP
ncbi:hypothetical protein [Corynebacterium pygosceleis]|uniref:hypothetical protein n=1 Tax=Corynebacterium pygosceleis TaxID=2800406 RepID=UPI001903CFEB|nr:hypothetical protein [Corynebacterium pygosceleis]MCL0120876.1 hypothetical protein [Corynebacterium pygosceleis]